ncbi:hypothetical protein ISN44_As06g043280 [Arabidopsis suecica]|uniref:Uncharacterized protein n=1 Tax=Arabidopsis suecica TaxID=45249 RepID=A0A8T2CTL8_ARASU|nr:hypothetical protein ISN44_As06g043280 [Arabidopsis suecica]
MVFIFVDFSDRGEVDRYLSASGYLGENTRPYFVALPKDRSTVSNDEFRRQISQVGTEVIRHLRVGVRGGFDEEKFRSYIGFGSLRDFLKSELQKRYKEAAPATLALLEERCSEVTDDMLRMEMKIPATSDVAHLRKAAMLYTASISNHVGALIDGAANQAPEQWGKTTEEERGESGIGSCLLNLSVLQFQEKRFTLTFFSKLQQKLLEPLHARSWLAPLLDTACDRLAFVLGSLFEIALERNLNQNSEYEKKNRKYGWILTSPYPMACYENDYHQGGAFGLYNKFNQTSPNPFCFELSDTSRDEPMKDQENILPENNNGQETTPGKGGESHITVPETPSLEQPCEIVYGLLHNILLRIREVLVERSVTSTLNSGFLTPCRDRLVEKKKKSKMSKSSRAKLQRLKYIQVIEELGAELVQLQITNEKLNGDGVEGLSYTELESLVSILREGQSRVMEQQEKALCQYTVSQMAEFEVMGEEWVEQMAKEEHARQFLLSKRRREFRRKARQLRLSSLDSPQELEHSQDHTDLVERIELLKSEKERLVLWNQRMIGKELDGMDQIELDVFLSDVNLGLRSVRDEMMSRIRSTRQSNEELISQTQSSIKELSSPGKMDEMPRIRATRQSNEELISQTQSSIKELFLQSSPGKMDEMPRIRASN